MESYSIKSWLESQLKECTCHSRELSSLISAVVWSRRQRLTILEGRGPTSQRSVTVKDILTTISTLQHDLILAIFEPV